MSGGVDSSIAAALLVDEGYDVFGVTLRLWDSGDISTSHHPCCITEDVNDARKVCQILGISHYVMDFQKQFIRWVVEPSCQDYFAGRTPNPCLLCNQHIKFRFLLDKAISLGADFIATGHYARIQKENNHYRLMKARDEAKDQSYFLYCLGQEELRYLLLPVGLLMKKEVRQIAKVKGLPVAAKHDSQDLCFVPGGDLKAFLKQRIECKPGNIIDLEGNILGQHEGIAFYTIGQRLRLNHCPMYNGQRLYVIRILPEENILVAGKNGDLFSNELRAGMVRWVNGNQNLKNKQPLPVEVKIRYGGVAAEALLHLNGNAEDPARREEVSVSFFQPQRAITPGQAAVFYQGEDVIGGGTILESRV